MDAAGKADVSLHFHIWSKIRDALEGGPELNREQCWTELSIHVGTKGDSPSPSHCPAKTFPSSASCLKIFPQQIVTKNYKINYQFYPRGWLLKWWAYFYIILLKKKKNGLTAVQYGTKKETQTTQKHFTEGNPFVSHTWFCYEHKGFALLKVRFDSQINAEKTHLCMHHWRGM